MKVVIGAADEQNVKNKLAELDESEPERLRLRVAGYDSRSEVFKGWIEVEPFVYQGVEGSFCLMKRDQVCFNLSRPWECESANARVFFAG